VKFIESDKPFSMNATSLVRIQDMKGDSEEDTSELRAMAESATKYIRSHEWCPNVLGVHFGTGVGGIVAVFLFVFDRVIDGTDDSLWVVVGDLPSAYLVVEPDETPNDALDKYCSLMEDWSTAVRTHGNLNEVFPVDAEGTRENADQLLRRIKFIREEILVRK
jgi:hypothetical protein